MTLRCPSKVIFIITAIRLFVKSGIFRINCSTSKRGRGAGLTFPLINSIMKLWLKIRFLFNSLFKKKTKADKDKIYPLY